MGEFMETWLVGSLGVLGVGLLAAHTWLVTHVAGQQGRMLTRVDAVETRLAAASSAAGSSSGAASDGPLPAPPFRLPGLDGADFGLDDLLAHGRPLVLLFADPGGGPGAELLPEVGRWQRDHAGSVTMALIAPITATSERSGLEQTGIQPVLFQTGFVVSRDYGVRFAPAAVMIRPSGALVSDPVYGAPAIRELLRRLATAAADAAAVREARAGSPGPAVGDPAPPARLPDPAGQDIDISDVHGEATLLLFWNPQCGYCQHLTDDLRTWEANSPLEAPRLLLVSRGTAEENAELGLVSPIVFDGEFVASNAYGVRGTPSAVLIEADGRVASEMARGIREVRTLIGLE